MLNKNQKLITWDKRDYIVTAVCFILAFVVGAAFFLLAAYLNNTFKSIDGNSANLVFLMVSFALICLVTYAYFYFEHRNFLVKPKNIFLIFALLYLSIAISYIFGKYINIYARPMAVFALFALMLIGSKQAVFLNTIFCLSVLILDTLLALPSEFSQDIFISSFIGFVSGMTAIFTLSQSKSRISVLFWGLVISVPMVLIALFYKGNISLDSGYGALWAFFGAMSSVVIFLSLLPIFEVAFNLVTNYRLYELTNHDSKLLVKLKNLAPGTFNHSVIVANMAETCAAAIGENGNLARAAAYYHDIGKIVHPEYFSENVGGADNPHDQLTPELSTEIIRSHTKEGYQIIKNNRLPEILGDVCMQHHGTMLIKFFYAKARKMTEGALNIEEFSYFGPKPQGKIAAIIMLADACEARVRTLNNRASESVEKGVDEIFEERMEMEQFSECHITMLELEILRKTIINTLTGIHHDRVKYPRLKLKKASGENNTKL